MISLAGVQRVVVGDQVILGNRYPAELIWGSCGVSSGKFGRSCGRGRLGRRGHGIARDFRCISTRRPCGSRDARGIRRGFYSGFAAARENDAGQKHDASCAGKH